MKKLSHEIQRLIELQAKRELVALIDWVISDGLFFNNGAPEWDGVLSDPAFGRTVAGVATELVAISEKLKAESAELTVDRKGLVDLVRNSMSELTEPDE